MVNGGSINSSNQFFNQIQRIMKIIGSTGLAGTVRVEGESGAIPVETFLARLCEAVSNLEEQAQKSAETKKPAGK